MELDTMLESLHREVNSRAARERFARARYRHSALERFADPQAVVDFLHDRRLEAAEARSAVTRAFVHEAQRRKDSLWSSILVVAFRPFLERLRHRMRKVSGALAEDIDSLVLSSFVEVVATLPLESQGRYAVGNLVRGTTKAVVRQLQLESACRNRECSWEDHVDELALEEALSAEAEMVLREDEQALDLERLRERFVELCRDEPEENVALLVATFATGTPLITYVREHFPEADDQELRQQYERFRRRRSRVFRRLRARAKEEDTSHSELNTALRTQEANDERGRPEAGDHAAPNHPHLARAHGAVQRRPAADRARCEGAGGCLPSARARGGGVHGCARQARDGEAARRAGTARRADGCLWRGGRDWSAGVISTGQSENGHCVRFRSGQPKD